MAHELLNPMDETNFMLSLNFELNRSTNVCGESTGSHYALDLLAARDITLDELLEGALAGLQRLANVPPAQQVGLRQAMQLSEAEICALLDDSGSAALAHTDTREPQNETAPAGTALLLEQEAQAIAASLYVLLEALSRFYGAETLPATRDAELADPRFAQPRPVHMDAAFVQEGVLTEQAVRATADGQQLWLTAAMGGKTLEQLGFMGGSCIEFALCKQGSAPHIRLHRTINPAFAEKFPLYKISERPVYAFSDEPVKIIPAGDAPKKNSGGLLISLLSPLLMTGSMLVVRTMVGGASSMLLYGAMACATVAVSLVNLLVRSREFRKTLQEWRIHYQEYITRTVHYLQQRKAQDEALLNQLYPPVSGGADPQPGAVWAQDNDIPAPGSLLEKTARVSGEIFSRGPTHPRFLSVRLGASAPGSQLVASTLPVEGKAGEQVFTAVGYKNLDARPNAPFTILLPGEKGRQDGYLTDLPAALAERYRYLHNAPVLVDLAASNCLGVVYPEGLSFEPFLQDLIFQLAMYHNPEDVQLVWFTRAKGYRSQQSRIELYKHLPHFHELFDNGLSQIAFDREQAAAVMDQLADRMAQRSAAKDGAALPHIVLLMDEADEFGFASHPLSAWLPQPPAEGKEEQEPAGGISFVFFRRYTGQLPRYCQQTILAQPVPQNERTGNARSDYRYYLVPHVRVLGENVPRCYDAQMAPYTLASAQERYRFCPDRPGKAAALLDGFKLLSSLYFYRIAQNGEVPRTVTLYDVIDAAPSDEELAAAGQGAPLRDLLESKLHAYITAHWDRCLIDRSLSAPLGLRSPAKNAQDSAAIVTLDLNQNGDGCHGQIAGSTGSGKSETLISYLLCLCLKYSPSQLNLILVDLKGGGFAERLGSLPHVVGSCDNLSGAKGESPLYMLGRFDQALRAEILYREQLFKQMGVDSISGYNAAVENLDRHITRKLKLDPRQDAERIAALRTLRRLPYLIIVIDEFAELMKISKDSDVNFRQLVDSLTATGRSLGMHLLLASQNITSAVSDEAKNNTSVYLALKLRDRSTSMEMIGTDAAARPTMPGHGRTYLKTAAGRFDYFQSTYTGGSWKPRQKLPVLLTQVARGGKSTCFYDSRDAAADEPQDTTQLELALEQIGRAYREGLADGSLQPPRRVCTPPLPARLLYETPDFRYEPQGGNCHA